jgi:hypothetical protein
MTDTPNLALPLMAAAQAQKHVTHNEALALLDALTQLSVISRAATAPPATPPEGARYLVPTGGTGTFSGKAGQIALFDGGAWRFLPPKPGWLAYVADEGAALVHDGSTWAALGQAIGTIDQLAALGIGTPSDAVNRLAVRAQGALMTARRVASGGTGDMRLTVEKEAAARTASLLFQSDYAGRAEMGLMGDDGFRVKVSADGATWLDALQVNPASGQVSFPNGVSGLAGGGDGMRMSPGGRLTLVGSTGVMTTEVNGASTVFYTPFAHDGVPLYDGTKWTAAIFDELSQTTTDATKSPAPVVANACYDVFVWLDGATLRATRGPAWQSATQRGTGPGSAEIEMLNGLWLNRNAVANGPAARRGTYVGTIRSNSSALIESSLLRRFVWNRYNQVSTPMRFRGAGTRLAPAGGPWEPFLNDVNARIEWVMGMEIGRIEARFDVLHFVSGGGTANAGFDLDGASVGSDADLVIGSNSNASILTIASAVFNNFAGPGYHYLTAMTRPGSTNTTFYGSLVELQYGVCGSLMT